MVMPAVRRRIMVVYLKEILGVYKTRIEDLHKRSKDHKTLFQNRLNKSDISGQEILNYVERLDVLFHLTSAILKEKNVLSHYTEKRIREIITENIAKKINELKSYKFNETDFVSVDDAVCKEIENIHEKEFAFQLLHLNYTGPDYSFDCCELANLKGQTIYDSPKPLSDILPKGHSQYFNYLIVKVHGNDNEIDFRNARNIADTFVGILKVREPSSPLLSINDVYFVRFKKGWFPCYKLSDPMHWDTLLNQHELNTLQTEISVDFNSIDGNELQHSMSASLIRFSNASKIYDNSNKLAEIVGCIETLMTVRSEAKIHNESIANRLVRRIGVLCPSIDKPQLKKIMEDYYDIRSGYAHQSRNTDVEINQILRLYAIIISEYSKKCKTFTSKKEFLSQLDKQAAVRKPNPWIVLLYLGTLSLLSLLFILALVYVWAAYQISAPLFIDNLVRNYFDNNTSNIEAPLYFVSIVFIAGAAYLLYTILIVLKRLGSVDQSSLFYGLKCVLDRHNVISDCGKFENKIKAIKWGVATILLMSVFLTFGMWLIGSAYGKPEINLVLRDGTNISSVIGNITCADSLGSVIAGNKVTCTVLPALQNVSKYVEFHFINGSTDGFIFNDSFQAPNNVDRVSFKINGTDTNNRTQHLEVGQSIQMPSYEKYLEDKKNRFTLFYALLGAIVLAIPTMMKNLRELFTKQGI